MEAYHQKGREGEQGGRMIKEFKEKDYLKEERRRATILVSLGEPKS